MRLERDVALGYLSEHPEAAARLLERMPEDETARLLEEATVRDLGAILRALAPNVAAVQLSHVPNERAAEALGEMGPELAAIVARGLPREKRRDVLKELPARDRTPIERLLRYPEGTAGALMDPRVASFHQSRLVSEVLSEVREHWRDLRYYVFVLDDGHRLVGVISLRELVSVPDHQKLESVMKRPVESLSARASRNAIRTHPGWKRYPQLPVVDESDHLLGVLRYRTYQSLQREGHVEEDAPGPLGLALALGELFWLGASGMFRGIGSEERDEERPR